MISTRTCFLVLLVFQSIFYANGAAKDTLQASWVNIDATGPSSACDAGGAVANSRFYTWGGYSDGNALVNQDVWQLDISDLEQPSWASFPSSPSSPRPTPRSAHALLVSESLNQVIVFGGYPDSSYYDSELWTFDLQTNEWTNRSPANYQNVSDWPIPRLWHSMAWLNSSHAVTYGGQCEPNGVPFTSDDKDCGDLWLLNTLTWKFTQIPFNMSEPHPGGLDGGRVTTIGSTLYLFGGYSCVENGESKNSFANGEPCYTNRLWSIDLSPASLAEREALTWTLLYPADPSADPATSPIRYSPGPSGRAYSVMSAYKDKLFIGQGASRDMNGDWQFYRDTFVFDLSLRAFIPFRGPGRVPSPRWSATVGQISDKVVIVGGCTFDTIYADTSLLWIDQRIYPQNCSTNSVAAFSSGLPAGQRSSLVIQTRSSRIVPFYSINTTGLINQRGVDWVPSSINPSTLAVAWGKNITWGEGLSFRVSVVGVGVGSFPETAPSDIEEMGSGQYKISFTSTRGTQVFVSVRMSDLDDEIPGSPFRARLLPGPISAKFSTLSGLGASTAVMGDEAVCQLRTADMYGNPAISGGIPLSSIRVFVFSNPALIQADTRTVWTRQSLEQTAAGIYSIESLIDQKDGNYSIVYRAPVSSSFAVVVTIDDIPINTGTPYLINGLQSLEPTDAARNGLRAFSAIGCAAVVACLILTFVYYDTAVMRASSRRFLVLIQMGCLISIGSTFALVERSSAACMVFPFLISIGYVMTMAAMFIKTIRIYLLFNVKKLQTRSLSDDRLMPVWLAAVLIEAVFNAVWWGVNPLSPDLRISSNNEVLTYTICANAQTGWWIASMSFKGAILLGGVWLAAQIRNIQDEKFNESKPIALVLYNYFMSAGLLVGLSIFLKEQPTGVLVIKHICIIWANIATCGILLVAKILEAYNQTEAKKKETSGIHSRLSAQDESIRSLRQQVIERNVELKSMLKHVNETTAQAKEQGVVLPEYVWTNSQMKGLIEAISTGIKRASAINTISSGESTSLPVPYDVSPPHTTIAASTPKSIAVNIPSASTPTAAVIEMSTLRSASTTSTFSTTARGSSGNMSASATPAATPLVTGLVDVRIPTASPSTTASGPRKEQVNRGEGDGAEGEMVPAATPLTPFTSLTAAAVAAAAAAAAPSAVPMEQPETVEVEVDQENERESSTIEFHF